MSKQMQADGAPAEGPQGGREGAAEAGLPAGGRLELFHSRHAVTLCFSGLEAHSRHPDGSCDGS